MAAIALTAAQVEVLDPSKAEIYPFIAAVTITAGQAVYLLTNGKVGLADADAAAPAPQFLGIALCGGGAGQVIDVLKRGRVGGFTVSGLNAGAKAYLSTTAGGLDTAATGTLAPVGMVVAESSSNLTKVLYVDAIWNTLYA
jgi:hypothetical protein